MISFFFGCIGLAHERNEENTGVTVMNTSLTGCTLGDILWALHMGLGRGLWFLLIDTQYPSSGLEETN